MATTNMAYDHPQYVINVVQGGVLKLNGVTAVQGASVAFVALTDTYLKSVQWTPITGGTSTAAANVGHLLGVHIRNGTGVASGTSTLVAAGDYGTGLTGTNVTITTTLSRGDIYRVLNTGTCAALIAAVGIEGRAIAGANVTS